MKEKLPPVSAANVMLLRNNGQPTHFIWICTSDWARAAFETMYNLLLLANQFRDRQACMRQRLIDLDA